MFSTLSDKIHGVIGVGDVIIILEDVVSDQEAVLLKCLGDHFKYNISVHNSSSIVLN
jgi:hypothetical protein